MEPFSNYNLSPNKSLHWGRHGGTYKASDNFPTQRTDVKTA